MQTPPTHSDYELKTLHATIDAMSLETQTGVLRIFIKHNVPITYTKRGSHVVFDELSHEVLKELHEYIQYVLKQEETINVVEKQKDEYKKTFFSSNNIT
jgi:hypothetical protein